MRYLLGLACSLAAIGCSCTERGVTRLEMSEAQCSNRLDDDQDGLADCDDPGCSHHARCSGMSDAGGTIDGGNGALPDGGPPADRQVGPSCSDPLDVVFVLDVSTSMDDDIARMRAGIESIWNQAHALTTNAQFGMVVFVDDALAVNGCAPFADLATLQREFDRWVAFCSSNRSPVSMIANIDCPENSLDAIHLAASSCPWREGATRILIHVTDDTFVERPNQLSSVPPFSSGVAVEHTYAEVAALLVSEEIRVGAFAKRVPAECGAGISANTAQGFFEPYRGMEALPVQTGGRAWDISELTVGEINDLIRDEYCTPFLI